MHTLYTSYYKHMTILCSKGDLLVRSLIVYIPVIRMFWWP